MTYRTLAKRHRPETEQEREAARRTVAAAETFAECRNCPTGRCVAACQLLDDEYERQLCLIE